MSEIPGQDQFSPLDEQEPCFGLCGLGCLAPFAITTPECESHDDCVEVHSHFECLINPPGGFSSLIEAAWSYFVALFFGPQNTDGGGSVGPISGINGYYTPDMIGMTFCTFDIKCIDLTTGY